MTELFGVLSAFGLSASAGLNAYIPLLSVALLARFTDLLKLQEPWDVLTSWWIIGLLAVLSLIEFFADKVPAVNHVNDIIQAFVRPAAGAVVFAASADVITDVTPVLSLGLGTAGFPAGSTRSSPWRSGRPSLLPPAALAMSRSAWPRSGLHGDFDLAIVVAGVDRLYFGFGDRLDYMAAVPPCQGGRSLHLSGRRAVVGWVGRGLT